MKKLVFLSALFALVAALVFTACKKDETTQSPETATWANPANPFDDFGARHNEGLDVLFAHPEVKPTDVAGVFRLLSENGFGQGDVKAYQQDFSRLLSMKRPIKEIADKHFREEKISEGLHLALLELDKIVMEKGFTDLLTTEVRTFEAKIPGLQLSENEARQLYQATSTARFSNQYWRAKQSGHATERIYTNTEKLLIIAADVAAAGGGPLAAIEASAATGWLIDFINGLVINTGGDGGGDGGNGEFTLPPTFDAISLPVGWPWGGGIFGPPCNPGYACPCTIELDPLDPAPFYMAGPGFYAGEPSLVLNMDGSQLGNELYDQLNTGNFHLDRDFTVPAETINALRAASGLPPQDMPTVFEKGDHEVIVMGKIYVVHIHVWYADGSELDVWIFIRN